MIKLLLDSSSDYSLKEADAKNIAFVPLTVTIGEHSYQDGVDITKDTFYEMLEKGNEFPKTSQPSPQSFLTCFQKAKEDGDELICILISSSLSGTCQSAHLAKAMADYDGIYVIDSGLAASLIKVLADYAGQLIEKGLPAAEIVEKIEVMKHKVKVVAVLDTLEYLYRGGRLNRTTAAMGDLARLKPIVHITEDGQVGILGKCIGKNKAFSFILNHLADRPLHPDFPIYSAYTYGTENCERLEEKLADAGYTVGKRFQIGSAIGTHIGPGIFAVIYVEE